MGAYGVGLFQDDVAADVRSAYLDLLAGGASDADANRTLLNEWKESIADTDDGPIFWLALAATQWEYGRLHSRVKAEALRVIDQGKGIERWAEAGLAKKRQALLAQLRKKLLASPPKRRTPRVRAVPDPPSVSLTGPDGNAEATAWQIEADPRLPQAQVYITVTVKRSKGGGSVFVAFCNLGDIQLKWLDDDTLRITYPKEAKVEQLDSTLFYYGRTIAVQYRPI